jgi:polycystin 1L2
LILLAGKCDVMEKFQSVIAECNIKYDMMDEADENYNVGWQPLPDGMEANHSAPSFIYRTASELDGYPFWGSQAVYSGGGYVVNLTGSLNVLLEKVAKLKEEEWMDRYTRAIFLEFTVYNPFVNLFGIVTLCVENIVSGGMAVYHRIEPMNLLGYYQEGFGFQIACECIYVVFIFIFIIKEARNIYRQGKGYFNHFWNWCELAIIVLSIAAVVIYFYRYIVAKGLVEEFKESHGNKYMKFQYVGYWNEILIYIAGWLVFLASIKFIKLLRFNKRMGMLAATLKVGAKPLLLFSIMFLVMFLAFAQFFYLIYFTELNNFRTVIHAMETCIQMLVGKFNFTVMQGSSPVLGPLVFFTYVVTVYYILINMFLTILNEAFASVRADISLQSDEYEMVSFILKRFKQWSGLQSILGSKKPKTKAEEFDKFASYEKKVQEFPERMDKLMDIISRAYFMADTLDAIFDPARPQDGKSAMKTMMRHVEEQGALKKKKGAPLPGSMEQPGSSQGKAFMHLD